MTRKNRSPIRPLSIAWLITLVAMAAFLWCAYDSYQRFTTTSQRDLRIQDLRGRIIHLEEVLTMSARMGALTGDPSWEERYRSFEPQLDAVVLVPRVPGAHALFGQQVAASPPAIDVRTEGEVTVESGDHQ